MSEEDKEELERKKSNQESVGSKPKILIVDNLELEPYQYTESLGFDKSLTINARVVLSEVEYAEIGKIQGYAKVTRQGIDNEPREMELAEIAWSKEGDRIKEEVMLEDKTENERIGAGDFFRNFAVLVTKQSLLIDELLNVLESEGILKDEKIKEIKTSITEERIWNKRRELNHSARDLDEFESLE
jgi:hypothetical protein